MNRETVSQFFSDKVLLRVVSYENGGLRVLRVFSCFVRFLVKETQKSVLSVMSRSDSQIGKPQHGRPERAERLDANICTGAQSINIERASLRTVLTKNNFHSNFQRAL